MLLEPGPLRLFTDAELPRPGARGTFEGLAARETRALEDAARELIAPGAALAGVSGSAAALRGDPALGAAAGAHDRQSRDVDSSVGHVAAAAGALEGDLAGLTNELAGELRTASVPEEPDQPAVFPGDPGMPVEEFLDAVRQMYRALLGREASGEEVVSHLGNPGGLAGVLATILASEEYQERLRAGLVSAVPPPAPPTRPAPPSEGEPYARSEAGVRRFLETSPEYRAAVERFAEENDGDWHRMPEALGLPGRWA